MVEHLISSLTNLIISTISSLGYSGIAVLMAVQTMAVPIPSEIILPFAGSLISSGRFSLLGLALAGALGSSCGASAAYFIGKSGGRSLVLKYGRKIFISGHDLRLAEKFLASHGALAVFAGMCLPVLRSVIALPAGVLKISFKKFLPLVFLGSFIWSLVLGYLGLSLGENWDVLRGKLRGLDAAIVVLVVLGVVWWLYRHAKNRKVKAV